MKFEVFLLIVVLVVIGLIIVKCLNDNNPELIRRKEEEEARQRAEYVSETILKNMRGRPISYDPRLLSYRTRSILYYCARNIIYDKHEDRYIQIVCDKQAAESLVDIHPDWELCYPSKELLEKVSAEIMSGKLFKQVITHRGILPIKKVSSKEERMASFSNDVGVAAYGVTKSDDFLDTLVESCKDEIRPLSEKFDSIAETEKNLLIQSHSVEYKDYLLKKTWLEFAYKVPRYTYLERVCKLRDDYYRYYSAVKDNMDIMPETTYSGHGISAMELRTVSDDYEEMIKNAKEDEIVPYEQAEKIIKKRVYNRVVQELTGKNKGDKMGGIVLMLYPDIK